jgi:plastocyanin
LGINNLSRIVLGIGITLSVAAVLSIYITSLASQNQSSSPAQQSASTSSPASSQESTQPAASNVSNSASANTTTDITIPQGASAQQVDQYYMPVNASIPKDATITWTNKDVAPHTATASDGSFDTGIFNAGSSASAMVKGQGDIQYHCTIHPWMHGSLQVTS